MQFNQTVRNTGEFGTDTYDLNAASSWPTTLYQADGSTPLTDTDGDGTPDTGPVGQGGSKTIVVKTALPAGTSVGASNEAQVMATSSLNPTKMKTSALPDRRARAIRANLLAIRPAHGRLLPPRPTGGAPDDGPVRLWPGRGHRAGRQYRPGVVSGPEHRK